MNENQLTNSGRSLQSFLSLLVLTSMLAQLLILPVRFQAEEVMAQEGYAGTTTVPSMLEHEPGAVAIQSQTAPDALTQPISISRVQSEYQTGSSIVISFTVTNNLLPARLPTIAETATPTETIEILANFDLSADPNTIRNLTIEDTLTPDATYLGSTPAATQDGSTYTWALDDLPPLASATITMTVAPPASAADFIDLDTGAEVQGQVWDRVISDSAPPALVAPDAVEASTLEATVDAYLYDDDSLWRAAAFDQDPLTLFSFVQGMRYEAYRGSLRGTRGTLWSHAGNSLDQSSLLIALLRASGVPARYRHGTLSTARAQELIASMFDKAPGVAGYVPAGVETADPVNDAALIAQVQDHWWVEAYLPGSGWTDLDPSFRDAEPGDVFADTVNSDGTDGVSEVPASERHTMTVVLTVEQYSVFPIGGTNLVQTQPLSITFSTAEAAAKRVTLGHLVTSDVQAGSPYANVSHTYVPYLTIADDDVIYAGSTFSDLLSNFPLSSKFTTAEWLEYEVRDPDGNVETFRRTVKDLIGPDTRLLGGTLDLQNNLETPPFATLNDLYVNWVLPNIVPTWVYERERGKSLAAAVRVASYVPLLNAMVEEIEVDGIASAEHQLLVNEAQAEGIAAAEYLYTLTGLDYAWNADQTLQQIEQGLQTKLYYTSPRLFTIASVTDPISGTVTTNIDLRTTYARTIVYPGQANTAAFTANWAKGVSESLLEGAALERIAAAPPVTTAAVFSAMSEAGILPILLTPADSDLLSVLPFPTEVQAHLLEAFGEGKSMLVPMRPVPFDGEEVLYWWEIDPTTGETISVGPDGLHVTGWEYRIAIEVGKAGATIFGELGGNQTVQFIEHLTSIGLSVRGFFFAAAAGFSHINAEQLLHTFSPSAPTDAEETWRYLPTPLCPIHNCGVEQFFVDDVARQPIPLPEMLFTYVDPLSSNDTAMASVSAGGSGTGSPSFTLTTTPATSAVEPYGTTTFDAIIDATFDDTYTVTVMAPLGWKATIDGSGQVMVTPAADATVADYSVLLVAQSSTYPDLFSSTVHTVTLTAADGMHFALAEEPLITVPSGPASGEPSNNTNDGETELAGMAYRISISNTSTVSHTFDIAVSGQPVDQLILNGVAGSDSARVTLPAGGEARVGLYVLPPSESVPAPGTTYPVDVSVTAVDAPGLADSASATAMVANTPFSRLALEPETIYVTEASTATFAIDLQNVGNDTGSFPLSATLPIIGWSISDLQSPIVLAMGASDTHSPTLHIPAADTGQRYPFFISNPVPDSEYVQLAQGIVQVVSANSGAIFAAADSAGGMCRLDEGNLSSSLESLALAVVALEQSCETGTCNLYQRDQLVAAAESAAEYAALASPLLTADDGLAASAQTLATHEDTLDIENDLSAISAAVADLEQELCTIAAHQPEVYFSPSYDASLPDQTVTYTLTIENSGNALTNYAVTVTLPAMTDTFTTSLAPDGVQEVLYPVFATDPGLVPLTAEIAVDDASLAYIRDEATAHLNVVDRFVQITGVQADPPFVETGTSATQLSVDVSNVANIAQAATAHVAILAPSQAVSYTADVPLSILIGAPRSYDLGTVDTSGWAAANYTITVELQDQDGNLIPDGSGYGIFAVGQELGASHAVTPILVAPGTVTVSTVISTEIQAHTIISSTAPAAMGWQPTGLRQPLTTETFEAAAPSTQAAQDGGNPVDVEAGMRDASVLDEMSMPLATTTVTGTVIVRYEEDEATLSGNWSSFSNTRSSQGAYQRSGIAGDTASFSFTGSWVGLGFLGDRLSGEVEVFIDGLSQGVLDLYRREETPISFYYGNLVTTTHTISITVLGTSNPSASGTRVQLDYMDVWNGGSYAAGMVEQDDVRVLRSTGWSTVSQVAASGGTYMRDDVGTVWYPFTGDSVTYQALVYNQAGFVRVAIDGRYRGTFNLYSRTTVTRAISFDGLGAGPHVLQVSGYQGNATIDAFASPQLAPPTPSTPTAFTRYEEHDPAFLYNGVPFTMTSQTWSRTSNVDRTSADQYILSSTAGDTVSFSFDGVWVSLGFATDEDGGQAEIFLDGVSQGTVDLYSNEDDVRAVTYEGLSSGTHTISATVLGTANPFADGTRVALDYVDVWDGSALAAGRFEQDDARVLRSGNWVDVIHSSASGGSFMEEFALGGNNTTWFAFTGDSVTFQAFDDPVGDEVVIRIDGIFQGYYDLNTGTSPTVTYSFDGLGAGLHVIEIRNYRAEALVDAFITPAITPPTPPPAATTFTRYEEDYIGLRYNGHPYTSTASTWNRTTDINRASDAQYISSSMAGDWVSFDFDGTWVHVGFLTSRFGGQADVYIDGVLQGTVDLYTRDDDVTDFTVSGLADTNHTISVTVTGNRHANASNQTVYIDYFDTWDGTDVPTGTYEQDNPHVWRSGGWADVTSTAASGGSYMAFDWITGDSTAWFPFTGDSVTFVGLATNNENRVQLSVDGEWQLNLNLYNATAQTRTVSFGNLGSGPHILQVRSYRGQPNVDAFLLPGTSPFYTTPAYTGTVRYEEDHPALRYNGYSYVQRPQSWSANEQFHVSQGGNVQSATNGDNVSLTFDGRWVNVGFRTRNSTSQAEIFIDGVSQGIVNLDNDANEDVTSVPFGGLITGTHTISVAVASGTVYFDYFDVWDGQPMSDDIVNAYVAEDSNRIHYSPSLIDISNDNAIDGAYVAVQLLNSNANVWYTFVGDSFTYYAFSRQTGGSVEVYVDGEWVDSVDLNYDFTEHPLAFHYTGFGEGAHVVRVKNELNLRVDGFASNPAQLVPWEPAVEWYDDTGRGNGAPLAGTFGVIATMTAGDVTGDGNVEIVATADDLVNWGTLFLYRGDGSDTGDGDPIIWSRAFGTGPTDRGNLGSPAIADLDGQPGAEIVVAGDMGLYALYNDGTTYWYTDTLQGEFARANPAIGNLDLDAEPEIVVNLNTTLAVFEADGELAWQTTFADEAGLPLLADVTGDGMLDILAYDWGDNVYLYDYNYGSPVLAWTTTISTSLSWLFGSPAIADVDGLQPGGDAGPEIAITSDGLTTLLDADGSVVWSTPLGAGLPGGVSIADVDGDGEVEIVTGTRYDDGTGLGRLYVLNADGSLLWEAPAYDSTSANSASVLDLNGDGVYEIAWNGKEQGFTIFNGADGSVLFNEPLVISHTATDYPAIVDVDQDGYAEILVPSLTGVVVFGFDGVWGEARGLWNQHSYHITNINDDLTVPVSELNSWDLHNTYRTQWHEASVLPVYDVTLTHTVAITGVNVQTDTFSVMPSVQAAPDYRWDYSQTWEQTVMTRTFVSELVDLEPGEARLVAESTEVVYTFPGGSNRIVLPPLYATAAHVIALTPYSQTVGSGGTTIYTLTLSNPGITPETYEIEMGGLPANWVDLPSPVTVPGETALTIPFTITVDAGSAAQILPFVVIALNSSGGSDQITGELHVIDALEATITPGSQAAASNVPVPYTLTISNHEAVERSYQLAATGMATVMLPTPVTVPGGSSVDVTITATAHIAGPNPFTVLVASDTATTSASAELVAPSEMNVAVALSPASNVAGPGMPAVYTMTVTNLGAFGDTYALSVDVPDGWQYELSYYGAVVDEVALPAHLLNQRTLQVVVTPAPDALAGSYTMTTTATSLSEPLIQASASATVEVLDTGVQVSPAPQAVALLPSDTGVWQVSVTNTGNIADSFWLTATGIVAFSAQFSANPLDLDPGESQTVQLTADRFDFGLPQPYDFAVLATSQSDERVRDEAIGSLTVQAQESVDVSWYPEEQVVTDTLAATYLLVVTNTGNVPTTFTFATEMPELSGQLASVDALIPPHMAFIVPLEVAATGAGVYTIEGSATSGAASDIAEATLTIILTNQPPTVEAGADQAMDEGQLVTFGASATDPESSSLDIHWNFGDGSTSSGTLTPVHSYDDNGTYLVTVVVTDSTGLSASDTLQITVANVAPVVDAGTDQAAGVGSIVSLGPATYSDAGASDTHTATIDWGNGLVEPGIVNMADGTVSGSHSYDAPGEYVVTVTVEDDDGAQGSSSFIVTIESFALHLPIIVKH